MPEDMADGFDGETQTWYSDDKAIEIRKESGVRLKILGINIDASNIEAIGTMKEDYLGLIETAAAG